MNTKVYRENEQAINALNTHDEIIVMGIGNSMTPLLKSKQKVVVSRVNDHNTLKKNDIVLVRVGRYIYLHKIISIQGKNERKRFTIGNNHGKTNGTVSADNIFGVVVRKL